MTSSETQFNPSSFKVTWDESGNLVVDIQGADPDGIQTINFQYPRNAPTQGLQGSISAPFAQDDGTAHVVVGSRHFPGDKTLYTVDVSQTLGPTQTPSENVS